MQPINYILTDLIFHRRSLEGATAKHIIWIILEYTRGDRWSASQISFFVFSLIGEKKYGHLITFKSISSKYKVFPGSIAMDFIFEFAIIGWVFAKLRLINDKIWPTLDPSLLTFPM